MNPRSLTRFASTALVLLLLASACDRKSEPGFVLAWDAVPDRPWAGPDLWANRLQDWQVRNRRLETSSGEPMRTAHILTARTNPGRGEAEIQVRLGFDESGPRAEPPAGAGILLGAGGPGLDWRKVALIHHSPGPGGGLFAGIDGDGRLFVRDFSDGNRLLGQGEDVLAAVDSIELGIRVVRRAGGVLVVVEATVAGGGSEPVTLEAGPFERDRVTGGLALAADAPGSDGSTIWFSRVSVSGRGLEHHEERALGAVLGAQHTLSRGVLTLTAQLFPVVGEGGGTGLETAGTIQLDVRSEEGRWYPLGYAPVLTPGFTATFRIERWPADRVVPYRLSLVPVDGLAARGTGAPFEGQVRVDPTAEDEIVVAAFTGNHNVASPAWTAASSPGPMVYGFRTRTW